MPVLYEPHRSLSVASLQPDEEGFEDRFRESAKECIAACFECVFLLDTMFFRIEI